MHMKTPELEARWLRILETIAAPNKVSFTDEFNSIVVRIEFVGGFSVAYSSYSKLSAIIGALYKLSMNCGEHGLRRIRSLIAATWNIHRSTVRIVVLTNETQIVISEKRFVGSTLHEAALYAFEASKFWRGVEKSAKFARYQANKLRG